MNVFVFIGGGVVLLFVGGIGGYFLRQAIMQQRKNSIEAKLKKLVEDSRQEAKQILIDAKTKSVSILEEEKEEEREREAGLRKNEERLEKREVSFEKQMTDFESRRLELNERVEKVEKEHGDDMAQKIRKLEQSGIEDLERRAKNILTTVIQRLAQASISEVTTTTVAIPSDELKGKIIGREGRNIRALERAAGVEIIVADTPGAIVI